jgi:hypothetical protein
MFHGVVSLSDDEGSFVPWSSYSGYAVFVNQIKYISEIHQIVKELSTNLVNLNGSMTF